MEIEKEQRKHQRLGLRLAVLCQKVGLSPSKFYVGNTVNVGPGGVLMEVYSDELERGQLLNIDMAVPPTEGLLEYGGRFSSYARVVRAEAPRQTRIDTNSSVTQMIALEFCQPPKLNV